MYRASPCRDLIEVETPWGPRHPDPAPGLSAPPLVGRLAGLPARALEALGSADALELLRSRESIEEELAEARQAMVAAVEATLADFEPAVRRLLLAVKRSCFNGREIGKHRGREGWTDLLQVASGAAERIARLEERLREADRALGALYERELVRERRHVLGLIEDGRFLRGVALGRPGLVSKIRSQAPALAASDFARSPAKWEDSLLRFVTRAAAKLSANSTLTSYALGSVAASAAPGGPRFDGGPRREISLVRLNRPQLEQFQTLLMRHPAVRSRALVAWNDSAEELEPGRFRFVRDGHWRLEPGADHLEYAGPVRIKVTPSSPLPGPAREALREGPLRYDELIARLEGAPAPGRDAPADVHGALEELVDLGLLVLLPPWPGHEAWLERRIGRFLRSLPEDPTLGGIAAALDRLLALESGFAAASRPERSVAEMEGAYARLMEMAAPLAGHPGPLVTRASFFEDVLIEPAADAGDDRGVFQVASATVERIFETARLISRFDSLFNLRHDVLHTLAAWWREHEPGRREMPFPELARGFAPVWREFVPFFEVARESALETFDPLSSPAVAGLRALRESLIARTGELVRATPERDVLPPPALAELLETLPRRYAPLLGSSVFVQPADPEGSRWVLNNVSEGTGRYLSRVVPALSGPRRERFLDHLTARSVIDLDGEEADLLEVKNPWIHLVRAHPPQAARVLDLRGLHLDLPRERRLALGDLTVQADLDAETFRLLDPAGRRVLPASLSTLSDAALPNVLRLLLMFGPGETRGVFPFPHAERGEVVTVFQRLTCGGLIVRRRSWRIALAGLRGRLELASDLQCYVLVDRWRRGLGLPAEGYYHEAANCGKPKPQYVRFDSPSLCRLFVSSVRRMAGESFHLSEALPSSADFPRDESRERRGFELLIDPLAIRELVEGSPRADRAPNRESMLSLRKE